MQYVARSAAGADITIDDTGVRVRTLTKFAVTTGVSRRDARRLRPALFPPLARLLRRSIIFLSLTASLIGLTGSGWGNESCVRSWSIPNLVIQPDRRLGEYRMELAAPDFRNRVSVQEHLKYSMLLGYLLKINVLSVTNGLCDSHITVGYYPDLYVDLMRRSTSRSLDSDRSNCLLALFGAMREIRVDDVSLRDAAQRVIETTIHWLAPQSVATEALADVWESLAHIYEANTAMNALVSVKPSDLSSVDLRGFMSWLDRQRAERRDTIVPLPVCVMQGETRKVIMSPGRLELDSAVTSPGVVKLILDRRGISTRRPLTRLVVFGALEELVAGEAFKMCRDKVVAVPFIRSSSYSHTTSMQVKCVAISPARKDQWLAFYCDPIDCHTEAEEVATIREIVRTFNSSNATSARSSKAHLRGPYLIEIEARLK